MSAVAFLVATFALAAAPAAAQTIPLQFEARIGAAAAISDELDDVGLSPMFALGAVYDVTSRISVYAGYNNITGWSASESFNDDWVDVEIEAKTSVDWVGGGLQFGGEVTPMLRAWGRAGLAYAAVTSSISDGSASLSFELDRTLGFELGGGGEYLFTPNMGAQAVLRFMHHTPSLEYDGVTESGSSLGALSIELGLAYRL